MIEIISSVILAILQSVLFYDKSIGISMLVFMVIGNGIVLYILKTNNKIKNKKGLILLIPIMLLSSTYLLFANRTFYVANVLVEVVLEIVMVLIVTNRKINLRSVSGTLIDTVAECDKGIGTTKDIIKANAKSREKIDIKKVAISMLVVFAVTIVVIILLASADSIFAEIFSGIDKLFSNWNVINTVIRLGLIAVAYIFLLSFILRIQREKEYKEKAAKDYGDKYSFTIKLLLIALNVVYLVFCYIQIKSLFAKINLGETFNYANYARSGFFQLMFVSFINFIVMFVSSKLNTNKEKLIKLLNLLLIVFTVIIVISSMYRMHMYEMAYGLTYLRMFVYIILITELAVFVPLTIYILKNDFKFIKWSLIIALIVYCVINFANLEKIIVNKNINSNLEKKEIDYVYISKIASEDSYSILEKKLEEELELKDELEITRILEKIVKNKKELSWQEFNISIWKIDRDNLKVKDLEERINNLIEKINKREQLKKLINEQGNTIYSTAINGKEQYVVNQVDKVMGTAVWNIIKVTSNGREYEKINTIEVTTPSKIDFFDNGLGFLERPVSIYCEASELLVTHDSGKTFEKINFPEGVFTLSDHNGETWDKCYDYFYLPTRDMDGTLTVLVSGGYEGGYNEGKTRAKYISKDNGYTWEFVSEVYKESI